MNVQYHYQFIELRFQMRINGLNKNVGVKRNKKI